MKTVCPGSFAFNAAQVEMLELQRAVMAGYSRENDEQVKSGKGVLQAHLYCVHCMVLALEHEVAEPLQWALKGESHLCEFGSGADRGGLESTGGRRRVENCSSEAPGGKMAPRQRLLSRRGSARGGSSRGTVADPHHHCCCQYCHRRSGASPLRVSQYMDSGSPSAGPPPLPAFGTVVFTLGGSRNNARINAHISVLFTEDPEDEEGGSGSKEEPSEDMQEIIEEAQVGVLEQTPSHPQANEASSSKQAEVDAWEGRPEGDGWSRILEKKPEE